MSHHELTIHWHTADGWNQGTFFLDNLREKFAGKTRIPLTLTNGSENFVAHVDVNLETKTIQIHVLGGPASEVPGAVIYLDDGKVLQSRGLRGSRLSGRKNGSGQYLMQDNVLYFRVEEAR